MTADHEEYQPAAILAELEAEAASDPAPAEGADEPRPKVLPIDAVEVRLPLFQCRPVDERHTVELAKAIEAGDAMPPLLVIRVGKRWVLLDGHHRLGAAHMANKPTVAVEVFEGSLKQAVMMACAANALTKLPMTNTERTEAAWKFVLLKAGSKADISKASGVSDRTVANMRRVEKLLGDAASTVPTWEKALRLASNRNPADISEEDREAWLRQTAQRHADAIQKTVGKDFTKSPEIAAKALAILFGRRIGDLALELRNFMPNVNEEEY